jgi:hypothetical protein
VTLQRGRADTETFGKTAHVIASNPSASAIVSAAAAIRRREISSCGVGVPYGRASV